MMRPISKGNQGGAVSSILAPGRFQHEWAPINNDYQVMSMLLKHNKLHLHQSYDTSCASDQIKDYTGPYGLSAGAKDILKGNFDSNIAANLPTVNHCQKHHI
eukprot:6089553-Ditylum_brightwellii.AAC.1